MLGADPMETGATLLEKAIKRFNRTQGPGKEAGNTDDYILKVRGGRGCGEGRMRWTGNGLYSLPTAPLLRSSSSSMGEII